MEYILGGLGALCCAGIIGGIGYGIYECCRRPNLDEQYNLIENINNNFDTLTDLSNNLLFNIKLTKAEEIVVDIQLCIDKDKIDKLNESFKGFKNNLLDQISNCKDAIIAYPLKFKVNKDGNITIVYNGPARKLEDKQKQVSAKDIYFIIQDILSIANKVYTEGRNLEFRRDLLEFMAVLKPYTKIDNNNNDKGKDDKAENVKIDNNNNNNGKDDKTKKNDIYNLLFEFYRSRSPLLFRKDLFSGDINNKQIKDYNLSYKDKTLNSIS